MDYIAYNDPYERFDMFLIKLFVNVICMSMLVVLGAVLLISWENSNDNYENGCVETSAPACFVVTNK